MSAGTKRRCKRKALERLGTLDWGDGFASAVCEVINISDGGAKLRPLMDAPNIIPDNFSLLLTAAGNVRRKCNVAWRSDEELGVHFAAD
jgi:hypothetical protein